MTEAMNILLVGVGGQGTILASRILASVARQMDQDVKVSEIHGMSQRGGSVVTQVRYGPVVHAPVISQGTADLIVGFEKLETLRWAGYLRPGGTIVMNTQVIDPMPVIMGAAAYPEGIEETLSRERLVSLPALELAGQAGSPKAANVVLLGAVARILDHGPEIWLRALEETVPERFLALNRAAFELGYGYPGA